MGEYYVARNGIQQGPWALADIVEKFKQGALTPVDYIYDDKKSEWVALTEFGPLSEKLKSIRTPAKAPPSPAHQVHSEASEHSITEWFVLKGENKFGPFPFMDVVKMLQQKSVFEYDFVWHAGMSSWKRIAEMSEFSPEEIRKVKESASAEVKEVFFRRRHRRVNYNGTLLVHDNKSVWKGNGIEISAGGAGVVMENAMIVPGQTLYLHFKPCDGIPPFNAVCEVVSKQYVEGVKDRGAPIRYGLRFTSLNPSTQQILHELAQKNAA